MIGMPSSTARSARRAQRDIEEGGGIKICCCRVFTCVNLNLLSTNHGLLKVSEVILGSCCQTLLVRFGLDSAADIGQAFNTCLTTVSSCLMTSSLLLFCYLLSTRTFNLVRQSLFVCFFSSFSLIHQKMFIFFSNNTYISILVFYFFLFRCYRKSFSICVPALCISVHHSIWDLPCHFGCIQSLSSSVHMWHIPQ